MKLSFSILITFLILLSENKIFSIEQESVKCDNKCPLQQQKVFKLLDIPPDCLSYILRDIDLKDIYNIIGSIYIQSKKDKILYIAKLPDLEKQLDNIKIIHNASFSHQQVLKENIHLILNQIETISGRLHHIYAFTDSLIDIFQNPHTSPQRSLEHTHLDTHFQNESILYQTVLNYFIITNTLLRILVKHSTFFKTSLMKIKLMENITNKLQSYIDSKPSIYVYSINFEYDDICYPPLTNIDKLPNTLQSISIKKHFLDKNIFHILKDIPDLKHWVLINTRIDHDPLLELFPEHTKSLNLTLSKSISNNPLALNHLGRLKSLKHLVLSKVRIDHNLDQNKPCDSLEQLLTLDLSYSRILNHDLNFLSHFTQLTELDLKGVNITNWTFLSLLSNTLKKLTLNHNELEIEDHHLEHLHQLEELNLQHVHARNWNFIYSIPCSLKTLNISYCNLEGVDLKALKKLTCLESLFINGVTLENWDFLSQLPSSLVNLDMFHTNPSSEDLKRLSQLKVLRELNLQMVYTSDISYIFSLPPSLDTLLLDTTYASIVDLLQNCHAYLNNTLKSLSFIKTG